MGKRGGIQDPLSPLQLSPHTHTPQYKIKDSANLEETVHILGGGPEAPCKPRQRRRRCLNSPGGAAVRSDDAPTRARGPGGAGDSPHHAYELPAGGRDPRIRVGSSSSFGGRVQSGGPTLLPSRSLRARREGKGRKGGGRQDEAGGRRPERASYLAEPSGPCTPKPPNPACLPPDGAS